MYEDINTSYIYLVDGEIISKEKLIDFNLEAFCEYKHNVWKINFVGFIFTPSYTIISFPKHFLSLSELQFITTVQANSSISLLKKLFSCLSRNLVGTLSSEGNLNLFPIQSYLDICTYYLKYGFHQSIIKYQEKGYGANINWNKTFKKSNQYITGKNIIFDPFILNSSSSRVTLITECMKYILDDGYKRVGSQLNIGINFTDYNSNNVFKNIDNVIKELITLKYKTFKDIELNLINSIISYLKWLNNFSDDTILITTHFDIVWEKLVHDYLNTNLNEILKLDYKTKELDAGTENIIFHEKITQKLPDGKFRVEYDHFAISDEIIFLFDSKYYKELNELNYKQFSYHFIIQDNENFKVSKTKIINGLIIPTENSTFIKSHLDMSESFNDGIFKDMKILEIHLNTKECIENFVKNY